MEIEKINKVEKLIFMAILLMALFSLLNIFDFRFKETKINFAGLTIVIGVAMYFVVLAMKKTEDLLNFKMISRALQDKNLVVLCLMPLALNIICLVGAKLFLPEFVEHLKMRTNFLAVNQIPLLIIQLAIAAIGEEIAWRGFFQNQLSAVLPFLPALIVTAALFAICHHTSGSLSVVLYDMLFIFINALLYGFIFRKVNNIFISSLAHFLANLSGIIFIFFL